MSTSPRNSPLNPPEPRSAAGGTDQLSLLEESAVAEPERPWRDDLADLVAKFRERRSNIRGRFDPCMTPEFDFEEGPQAKADGPGGPSRASERDLILEHPRRFAGQAPTLEAGAAADATRSSRAASLGPSQPAEWVLEPHASEGSSRAASRFFLDSFPHAVPEGLDELDPDSFSLAVAPLDRRFIAGIVDALVLALAGGLFGLVFWGAGGHLKPQPAEFAVLAMVASFFVLVYFASFSALTFATPGQQWSGLAVRDLEGGLPTPRQALWRAFGYLVSGSAFMLGFIWAAVDSDGLTWHDRMSGTCLVVSNPGCARPPDRAAREERR